VRTAIDIAESVRSGARRAVDILDECLDAIDTRNPELNAFVAIDRDGARRAAADVDAKVRAALDPGPFAGVPFGVKDLYDLAGLPTSKGSLLFKGGPPAEADAVDVARLRAAGAVPVGKTAVPEFGSVCFTASPAWGVTRNPWNLAVTPGGSSGGSAAAVAGGLVPMATGGDGGGSIRIPAAWTGLVGLKPSFGRIPYPDNLASETDTKGVLVASVADAARHLDVTCGPDDRDRTSLPHPGLSYEGLLDTLDVSGLRVGWSPDLGYAAVEPEVEAIAEAAARDLVKAAGLPWSPITVKLTDPVRVWLGSGSLDLYQDLERGMWPDRGGELHAVNRYNLTQSDLLSPAQVARVWMRRRRLEQEVARVHADVDVVLTPTTAVAPFAAAGPIPEVIAGQSVFPAMAVPFTMIANLCWNPAASVPAGLTAAGLPVGLQIQARRHADELVLRLARLLEQARPWPTLPETPPSARQWS
jgi:aspartyl-tRNA(Asn)/glutamyl-tRNA(Gln) amidotransferase subunit A